MWGRFLWWELLVWDTKILVRAVTAWFGLHGLGRLPGESCWVVCCFVKPTIRSRGRVAVLEA